MVHLSGGAVSGIVFGSLLFFLGSVSLLLWWRRVHRDLYSNDPNVWGGSWGVKAQRETQARLDRAQEQQWVLDEIQRARVRAEERSKGEVWTEVEMQARKESNDGPTSSVVKDTENSKAHKSNNMKDLESGNAVGTSAVKSNPSS